MRQRLGCGSRSSIMIPFINKTVAVLAQLFGVYVLLFIIPSIYAFVRRSMSSSDIADVLEPFSSYSASLSRSDCAGLHHVARCFAQISKDRFHELLDLAVMGEQPLLQVHASDGWSCDVSEIITLGKETGFRTARVGRRRQEYLMELLL